MTEVATETTGKIVWFEVPAEDSGRARSFYGQLFAWQFEAFGDEDYHVTQQGAGAVYGAPGQKGMLAYFGVADIDAAMRRVAELGGEAGDKQEMPGIGLYAHCADTEGNPFGLYQDGGAQ